MNFEKLNNTQIAWRAAQDIQDGAYVNLGIGIPTLNTGYSEKVSAKASEVKMHIFILRKISQK